MNTLYRILAALERIAAAQENLVRAATVYCGACQKEHFGPCPTHPVWCALCNTSHPDGKHRDRGLVSLDKDELDNLLHIVEHTPESRYSEENARLNSIKAKLATAKWQ